MNCKAVLFDFDGTISTLRAGWEEVMGPFMKESIFGPHRPTEAEAAETEAEISAYIDRSTGIQTVFQMRWLADKARSAGWNPQLLDEWGYKFEYNRRLLLRVEERIRRLEQKQAQPDQYLIKGAALLLERLKQEGVRMFVASGTDHPDVVREAGALGVAAYFQHIAGAPAGRADCSKERVIRELLHVQGFAPEHVAVIGDGKVEIALAKEYGAKAFGLASDEERREGVNPVKMRRLQDAGADWISGDFLRTDEWLRQLGISA